MPGPARRCAVLGSPVAHSLSPALHRAAYVALGLDWSYEACEVREDGLAAFLDGLDASWRGLSLTMPLKRAVVPLLDEVSARAEQAGAVNTVIVEQGRRSGHNTDVPGAVAALRGVTDRSLASAVVLGGGATAASTMLALTDLGCIEFRLVVRDPARVEQTLAAAGRHPAGPRVQVTALRDVVPAPADILVSTIPAGAQDATTLALAAEVPVVFDVVYDPWPTPLAAFALSRGRSLVSGLDLLLQQAALQVELMTGLTAPLPAMRAAGERALARR